MAVRGTKQKSQSKRWVAKVTTDSTHPPEGLFTKSAATIARTLASKKVSPKGPSSGMRMLNYFINRGGRNLSPERKQVLQEAICRAESPLQRQRARRPREKTNCRRKIRFR